MTLTHASADQPDMRLEMKVIVPHCSGVSLSTWAHANRIGLRRTFDPRTVRNIYLDTEDYACLYHTTNGLRARSKWRVRWYDESWLIDRCTVECKKRLGNVGWKCTVPIDLNVDLSDCSGWRSICNRIWAAMPAPQRIQCQHMARPSLINHYHRDYFATFDGAVRVTVDRKMTFWPQTSALKPQLSRKTVLRNKAIVEVKAPPEQRETVQRIMASLPARGSWSKYRLGMTGS